MDKRDRKNNSLLRYIYCYILQYVYKIIYKYLPKTRKLYCYVSRSKF